jgi:hypothetical protein
MPNDDEQDYEVGYRKPPQHSRFRKGQSGNPKGRPRGSKNLATLLDRELDQMVVVREHGRARKITKREASVKQLVNKWAAGDSRFTPSLVRLMERQESQVAAQGSMPVGDDQVIDPEHARQLQETWNAIRKSQPGKVEGEEDQS